MKRLRPFLLASLIATVLPSVALGPTACGGDPVAEEAAAYQAQLSPLLIRNGDLARQFLELAGGIDKKQIDTETIASRWQDHIIPTADGLKADVQAIEPATPEFGSVHELLVEAWTDRARAYHEMLKAYRASDSAAFKEARQKNADAKLVEERYFQQLDQLLARFGYHVDPFPG